MIGIIGCGAMGGGMVQRLLERGHRVLCHDALPEARARAASYGADSAEDVSEIAERCDVIFLSLPRAEAVEAVMTVLGPLLPPGAIVVDTTTSEPETTRVLAQTAAGLGYAFLDGPVSGGPQGARQGTMTMVLGGEAGAIERIRPILNDLATTIVHVGPAGSGHAAKIANNLLCAANLVLVSEMTRLAARNGVSLDSLLAGVNAGSGRSGVSEVNFPRWILSGAFDSGFTMGLMRKDVALAAGLADRVGLDLPATRAIADIWESSREMLPDSADFNEIYKYGNLVNV